MENQTDTTEGNRYGECHAEALGIELPEELEKLRERSTVAWDAVTGPTVARLTGVLADKPIRVGVEYIGDDGETKTVIGPATFKPGPKGSTIVTVDTDDEHPDLAEPGEIPEDREAYRLGHSQGLLDARPKTAEAELLRDATNTINGERQDQYGNAEDSFAVIGEFWSTYIRAKYGVQLALDAIDTALLLDLMKTARLTQTATHRDSFVDKAGYSALGWRAVTQSGAMGKVKA
ncbi:hypothetical protein SEA_MACGULLY_11 [Rhodococcus phage MacGully]|nr:hypothetical protein SEA_MACGULLY_11 [Rhodococcus phage MacGully]